jgi:glycosyltransferase involved in cell wall biosynthesis
LLFVGNLVPVKGIDVLLAACRRLNGEFGPWQLHLVGGGPLRQPLAREAKELGLESQVVFHGQTPHDELPAWFRAADLLVLPSRSEGVPNVLLEAMACGLPFVASRVGGIPEIAHLGPCRLVTPQRPAELASAITEMLASPVQSAPGPRDRREAVAEIAQFLETCAS